MASEQVIGGGGLLQRSRVIGAFTEQVTALPEVDHVLLIADGSSDVTVAVICAWQKSHADQAVTPLELTRNFLKEPAMMRGWTTPTAAVPLRWLLDFDLQ